MTLRCPRGFYLKKKIQILIVENLINCTTVIYSKDLKLWDDSGKIIYYDFVGMTTVGYSWILQKLVV